MTCQGKVLTVLVEYFAYVEIYGKKDKLYYYSLEKRYMCWRFLAKLLKIEF